MRIIGVVCLIVAGVLSAFAQGTFQSNQYISVNAIITDADIINAASLVDPLQEKVKEFAPTTFSLNMTATGGKYLKVSMDVLATVTLEEDRQTVTLVTAKTHTPFVIPGIRVFTSKDAQEGASKDIDFDSDINEPFKEKLKDKVTDPASGGKVPSGSYYVRIGLTVDSVANPGSSVYTAVTPPASMYLDYTFNITNPTTAVLDVPFNNGYVYPTAFPQFQWTYDTRAVRLSVYEKRPEHQSLEDAIAASDPYLQVEIDRRQSGNMTTFTYPQTAASRPGVTFLRGPRQLERGKMYVVVLDGITTAFGFEVDPLRTVRSFVIADPQGQVMLNVLQTVFGSGDFQNMYNAIEDMGLTINTNGITLNGVRLTPQDLQKILVQNKDRIVSVRIEE